MKLTLLGTGTPTPNPLRRGPSQIIESGDELILVDCGAGALHRYVEAGYRGRRINRIIFTHLHSDHITGLADVLWASWIGRWNKDGGTPLISGPPGTTRFVERLIEAHDYDIDVRTRPGEGLPREELFPRVEDVDEGWLAEGRDYRISAFRVDHAPVDKALGFRIDGAGASVVVSGDTRYSENLIAHSQDADILVHEVYDRRGLEAASAAATDPVEQRRFKLVMSYHTAADEVARAATAANAHHLVLSHLITRGDADWASQIEPGYKGKLTVGEDLQVFEVGK
ncbi:MAG TPA: MBL fold metallo-hydrolase [Dehalococcoidia bacterium]|nr:MBL fold metallo-hydrolase [Dehalococcoidia bacterium]